MKPLQYDWSWEDLPAEEVIVIQKCTVCYADLAYRSPQFPDWIHIEKDGKPIHVWKYYDWRGDVDPCLFDWGPDWDDGGGVSFGEFFDWSVLKLLKKYDGVFIDMEAAHERWNDCDDKSKFDVSDLVKPWKYFLDDDE